MMAGAHGRQNWAWWVLFAHLLFLHRFLKIWDLDTQHCVQTIVGHHSEIWAMAVNQLGTRLCTGSSDNTIRVWSLEASKEVEQPKEGKSFNVPSAVALGGFIRKAPERVRAFCRQPIQATDNH